MHIFLATNYITENNNHGRGGGAGVYIYIENHNPHPPFGNHILPLGQKNLRCNG